MMWTVDSYTRNEDEQTVVFKMLKCWTVSIVQFTEPQCVSMQPKKEILLLATKVKMHLFYYFLNIYIDYNF